MLLVNKSFRYAGRALTPGEEFKTSDLTHARLMLALGNVRDVEAGEADAAPISRKGRKATYQRRDMIAASPVAPVRAEGATPTGSFVPAITGDAEVPERFPSSDGNS